jgi:ABC-type enterochelin transport system permease subunit
VSEAERNPVIMGHVGAAELRGVTQMGNDQRKRPTLWLLFLPAAFFLVKDLVATVVVLSYEPGISAVAVLHYAYTLLPGTLFVVTGYAPLVNLVFGTILGVILYLFITLRRRANNGTRLESNR